eukprot:CAMPEP_0169116236 /NCGR_PEP_ID=MMETSP1015-20121227/29778_1 /TAXON_ID=342587 /ORGANISM="Karlodinium micrum, Strain CCMP2283" /LENGTH=181 /DNA_ID=CAMNT_0009178761 /DNA_START=87 /DNA_END=629 /DNA_ORIENTATION=-
MTSLALAEGVIELEERSPDDFEPNDQETCDYAKFLGIDPEFDMDLLYLAKEGLKAPLPVGWKPCQNSEGNIFYFNTENGKSSWNHPADEEYKQKVKDIKAQRAGGNNVRLFLAIPRGSRRDLRPCHAANASGVGRVVVVAMSRWTAESRCHLVIDVPCKTLLWRALVAMSISGIPQVYHSA